MSKTKMSLSMHPRPAYPHFVLRHEVVAMANEVRKCQ